VLLPLKKCEGMAVKGPLPSNATVIECQLSSFSSRPCKARGVARNGAIVIVSWLHYLTPQYEGQAANLHHNTWKPRSSDKQ